MYLNFLQNCNEIKNIINYSSIIHGNTNSDRTKFS